MKHPCKHTRAWRCVGLAKEKFWRIPASIYREITFDKLLYGARIFINPPKINILAGCDRRRIARPNWINEDEIALIEQAVWIIVQKVWSWWSKIWHASSNSPRSK